MTLSVLSYHDEGGFETLASKWNGLLRRSAADTIFLTLEFQRTWWQALGKGDLLILAVRDGEELVGIAPLFAVADPHEQRVLATVGCTEVADYLDWIAARGREEEVYAALVDYLARQSSPPGRGGEGGWDALDLCNIHQDSPTLALLPAMAQARGWTVSISKEDVCPIMRLPKTWEEYLQMLDGKQRHEMRRKLRRAEAEPALRWYIVGAEHNLEAEVEDFLTLMAASTPDKAAFLTPQMRDFFRRWARVACDAGWLQLAFLEIEGRKAAAYFNFVYNNRVMVYNSGLDWAVFPQLSAGIVLMAYCIRQAIERGHEVFDFMQGDERYKYDLGGRDVEVRRLVVRKA
jgi:CelD/BcsL family acetyltransferase involved in cellulose biosynthesis